VDSATSQPTPTLTNSHAMKDLRWKICAAIGTPTASASAIQENGRKHASNAAPQQHLLETKAGTNPGPATTRACTEVAWFL